MSTELDAGLFPQRVTLELTNICNLRCTFCPRRYMEKERGYLDTDLALSLLDEMAEHQCQAFVPFFRGESLLHRNWAKILRHAIAVGAGEVQFTSNASLLTPEATEELLDMGIHFISFSLDTMDADLYNNSRKGGNLDTSMKNVLHFLKRREETGSSTKVQVSSVETAAHRPGMNDFIDFWKEHADRVRIYAEHSADGNFGSLDETLPKFDHRLPCKKLFTDMVVYWNGEAALCNHDWARLVHGKRLGNVAGKGIADIWRGGPYEELRALHRAGTLEGCLPCEGCDHWKMYYMESGFLGQTFTRELG